MELKEYTIERLIKLMAYSRIEKVDKSIKLRYEERWYIHREISNRFNDQEVETLGVTSRRKKMELDQIAGYKSIEEKLIQLDKLSVDWIKPNEKI